MAEIDIKNSLANLKLERDAIALYEALATIEREPRRGDAFRTIASNERRHAEIWARKLRELGADVPAVQTPRLRIRVIVALARLFGTRAVSDLVQALEGDEESAYTGQVSVDVAGIMADERVHAEMWRDLEAGREARGGARGALGALISPEAGAFQADHAARDGDSIGRDESWHRAGQSGTLRAVIFGVSDGLVSNTSLVMGMAGAVTTGSTSFVLLAGIAGLLAGSFSMAAGEYISMQSQRELYERQIELERAELEAMPREEEAELAAIFRSKGFTAEEAQTVAERLGRDPEHALDTLIREELGLDPNELGSPWRAAFGSFGAFAAGAIVPVLPLALIHGAITIPLSIGLSLVAMFAVGAAVSLMTGRSALFSGARQVVIGIAAASVTFLVGRLIGVSVS